jgi:hypothetical protein
MGELHDDGDNLGANNLSMCRIHLQY